MKKALILWAVMSVLTTASTRVMAQSTMQDTLHAKDKNKFYGAPATTTLSKKQEKANQKIYKRALRLRKQGKALNMQQEIMLEKYRHTNQPK